MGGSLSPRPPKATSEDSLVNISFPTKLQLQLWADCLEAELKAYRSAFIATNLLMERVKACCTHMSQPNILTLAAALMAFSQLCELLGPYEPTARGILDELLPAIYIVPARCGTSLSTNVTCFARRPFFDAFQTTRASFVQQSTRAFGFSTTIVKEERVLDRAVALWQRSLALKTLQKWRALAKYRTFLRQKYQMIFRRVTSSMSVHTAVTRWRRYAHTQHFAMLASKTVHSAEQLEQARTFLKKTNEDLRQAQEESARSEANAHEGELANYKLRQKISQNGEVLKQLHIKYGSTISAWAKVVARIFGDAHRTPRGGDYAAWIADLRTITQQKNQSAQPDPTGRAAHRSAQGSPTSLRLNLQTILEIFSVITPAAFAAVSENFPSGKHTNSSSTAEMAERICSLFRKAFGLYPPITPRDLLRGDQYKMRSFVLFLMELHGGGCCGQYFPNFEFRIENKEMEVPKPQGRRRSTLRSDGVLLAPPAAPPAQTVEIIVSKPSNSLAILHQSGLKTMRDPALQELMDGDVETICLDWEAGRRSLDHARSTFLHTEAALREVVECGETVQTFREVQHFFDLVSASSASGTVPQMLLEKAIKKFVREEDWQLVPHCFPEDGINNVTDLVGYVDELAEMTGIPRGQLVQKIEEHLEVSSGLDFLLQVREEQVQVVVSVFEKELHRTFCASLVDDENGEDEDLAATKSSLKRRVSRKRSLKSTHSSAAVTMNFTVDAFLGFIVSHKLDVSLGVDAALAREIFSGVQSFVERMDEFSFTVLLCVLATYADPSPFLPLHMKLKTFLKAVFGGQ